MIQADYQAIMNATAKGKSASPIHYNAMAYRDSEIQKMYVFSFCFSLILISSFYLGCL